jgi:hypothetical protein
MVIQLYGRQELTGGMMTMAIIFYLPGFEERGETLLRRTMDALPRREIEAIRVFTDLRRRLLRPLSNLRVAVLFCMTKADLQDIFSLEGLLLDMKIILILPDDDAETLVKAHHLRPRYLSWLDDDFMDIGVVLQKMIELYDVPLDEDG